MKQRNEIRTQKQSHRYRKQKTVYHRGEGRGRGTNKKHEMKRY